VCFNIAAVKSENGAYTYNGVTGKQVIEYIETYLASAGFLIDTENEIFGMFIFTLSNNKTQENVRVSYTKSDKTLMVTLSNGWYEDFNNNFYNYICSDLVACPYISDDVFSH